MRCAQWMVVTPLCLMLVLPDGLDAQSVFKRIKENAKQKVTDRKAQTKDHIVNASGEPVDSALAKAGQPVDSAISKTASGVAGALAKSADGAKAVLGANDASQQIVEALEAGRAVLPEIAFHPGTALFDESAEPALTALRDALNRVDGMFLIEGHVAEDGVTDAASLQHLSAQRATAVKEWLAMSGIDPSRLLALGVGWERGAMDRIEIATVR